MQLFQLPLRFFFVAMNGCGHSLNLSLTESEAQVIRHGNKKTAKKKYSERNCSINETKTNEWKNRLRISTVG